jgi:hypothetical protein
MQYSRGWFFLFVLVLLGCNRIDPPVDPVLQAIMQQVNTHQKVVDMRNIAGDEWEKVCFFGPYTLNAKDVLGLDWELSTHAPISDDMIDTIVFASSTEVIRYVISPGRSFRGLAGRCFPKQNALFTLDATGRAYMH